MIQIGSITQIGPIEKGSNVVPCNFLAGAPIAKRLRAGAFEAAGDDMKSEWRLAKVQAAVSRL